MGPWMGSRTSVQRILLGEKSVTHQRLFNCALTEHHPKKAYWGVEV